MTPRLPPLLLLLALASCSGEQDQGAPAANGSVQPDSAASFSGRVFERNLVFMTTRQDSSLLVPWLTSARTHPGGVRREARGYLARSGAWEPFFADAWDTSPTRLPWRIVPRGQMRLIVGGDDALEQILFDEGPRQLEVVLQEPFVEWSGTGGETFRLLDGALILSSTRLPGLILDMTRGRPVRDPPGGDWAIVVAGDTLQMVLHAAEASPPGTPGAFQAWALTGLQELRWQDVTVRWGETRAFERARRDVPVEWSATADDGDMQIDLAVRNAQMEAGEGEGPQLPVNALFEVEGTLRIGSAVHAVRGLLRHIQP